VPARGHAYPRSMIVISSTPYSSWGCGHGGARKSITSRRVHTWSVSPAAIAGVQGTAQTRGGAPAPCSLLRRSLNRPGKDEQAFKHFNAPAALDLNAWAVFMNGYPRVSSPGAKGKSAGDPGPNVGGSTYGSIPTVAPEQSGLYGAVSEGRSVNIVIRSGTDGR